MNALYIPTELQIGIDVGSLSHFMAIGDNHGNLIKEFEEKGSGDNDNSFLIPLDDNFLLFCTITGPCGEDVILCTFPYVAGCKPTLRIF